MPNSEKIGPPSPLKGRTVSSTPRVDLDQICDVIAALEGQRDQAIEAIDNAKARLMEQLRAQGVRSSTTQTGRKITIVEGVRTSYDSDILQDILGPNLWEEVTKRVLDPNRLESVVERENISPGALKDAVKETPVKAYPRITPPKKTST